MSSSNAPGVERKGRGKDSATFSVGLKSPWFFSRPLETVIGLSVGAVKIHLLQRDVRREIAVDAWRDGYEVRALAGS